MSLQDRRRQRTRRRALLTLLAAGLVLWLATDALRFSLGKFYTVDEFQYAHGAWKVAQGEVIYRDFFEHHFPLVHHLVALVWLGLDQTNPHNIEILRLAMLPFLALTVFAAAWLNRRWARGTGWVTAIVLLSTLNVQSLATEIRPDPIALAFFLSALAVLDRRRSGRRSDRPSTRGSGTGSGRGLGMGARGFLSGLCLTLSVWGSQKVLYYGIVFPAAFVADLMGLRRTPARRSYLLGHPLAFAAGSLTVLIPIGLYLVLTGSLDDWFHWCLSWSFVHQEHYPSMSWVSHFQLYTQGHVALYPFAALGVWQTMRSLRRSLAANRPADPAVVSPDVLLLGALVTTTASFVWQTAPYLYSLLPVTAMLSLFAARGLVWSFRSLRALSRRRTVVASFGTVALILLLAGQLSHVRTGLARLHALDNESQHVQLQQIAELTAPDDPVYNITGNQVARPSVHFFYFTDAVVRDLLADRLAREIPEAILETGCTVYTHDERFSSLPPSLQAFLLEHFQPLTRNLWIWGQRYVPRQGSLDDEFLAVRDGRYYISPPEALARGTLHLNGRPVASPVVDLPRGRHTVEYRGPVPSFHLLWLPRDETLRPAIQTKIPVPAQVPGGRGLPPGFERSLPNQAASSEGAERSE